MTDGEASIGDIVLVTSFNLRFYWYSLVGVFSIGHEGDDSYGIVLKCWNWKYVIFCSKVLSLSNWFDNSVFFINTPYMTISCIYFSSIRRASPKVRPGIGPWTRLKRIVRKARPNALARWHFSYIIQKTILKWFIFI